MAQLLTIAELMQRGKPLEGAAVVAGSGRLNNGVIWAVSVRPYAPAIPPLKGGEVVLAGSDILEKHEPAITLVEVVRQLQLRNASALVVRGEVAAQAIKEADDAGIPLIVVPSEVALHDVEQDIIRECAVAQARHEIMASDEPGAWVRRLLSGEIVTFVEAQAPARREGYKLGLSYRIALVTPLQGNGEVEPELARIADALAKSTKEQASGPITHPFEEGLAVLLPPDFESTLCRALSGQGMACGIGSEHPLLEASASLRESRLALLSSRLLHRGDVVQYEKLGAERMLLILYLNNWAELQAFVLETLGPLIEHDAKSASPLLPTIASFVEHGGRLRETATALYVHRNTLSYRLDNASELLGVDLKDADSRLAVEMALRALPLMKDADDEHRYRGAARTQHPSIS